MVGACVGGTPEICWIIDGERLQIRFEWYEKMMAIRVKIAPSADVGEFEMSSAMQWGKQTLASPAFGMRSESQANPPRTVRLSGCLEVFLLPGITGPFPISSVVQTDGFQCSITRCRSPTPAFRRATDGSGRLWLSSHVFPFPHHLPFMTLLIERRATALRLLIAAHLT